MRRRAVCPKCEKFYRIPTWAREWYCAHAPEMSVQIAEVYEITGDELPKIERIKCKVVEL